MNATETTQLTTLFEKYLKLRGLRDGTVEIYRYAMRHFVLHCGDGPAAAVKPLDAMEFAAYLGETLPAAATANMYLRCLKAFFRWLVAIEELPKSPFANVKSFRDKSAGKEIYRGDELRRLMEACVDDRWRLIVALAITTGMRRGEILNLTVSEVDYAAGVIEIRDKADSATTWKWQIKDDESRKVPIVALVERYLLKVHSDLPECQPYLCLKPSRYQHLMRLKRCGRLNYAALKCPEVNFLRSFRVICKRAGVAYRTFHALRGSCLSLMAESLQPHELKAIAGHSDIRTTYSHYIRPDGHLEKARLLPQKWAVQDLNL